MQKNKAYFSCCAAIVTYGDRLAYLEKSVNFCIQSKLIQSVVIIDNNSSKASKKGIKKIIASSNKKVICQELDRNYGSALGFKKAIEESLKTNSDLVYLLDDDNLPKEDCLEKQFELLIENKVKTVEGLTVTIANREDRINFQKILQSQNPKSMLQPENHYLGVHYGEIIEKLKERLFYSEKPKNNKNISPQKVIAAPYSGLLFHRNLIEKVGLPDEDFVLYMDDFDFTIRTIEAGGNIWLIPNAIIQDIENSVYLPERKSIFYHSAFDGNINQMYYLFRNMKYFGDRYLLKNKVAYTINKILFWCSVYTIGIIRGKFDELKMLLTAVKDANNNRMGESDSYILK